MIIATGYILTILFVVSLLLLCHFMQGKGTGSFFSELCRKTVHILIFVVYFIFKYTFGFTYHAVITCLLLVPIAIYVEKKGVLGDSLNSTPTYGISLYAVSMTLLCSLCCFIDGFEIPFGIAALCTCFGDGLASVVGLSMKENNPRILWNKTLLGSITCFTASLLSVFIFSTVYASELLFYEILSIAAISCISELISPKRTDNLTLPIATAFISYNIITNNITSSHCLIFSFVVLAVVIVISKKILTPAATLCALIIGSSVFYLGGAYMLCVLASFFVIAVITDNVKKSKKVYIAKNIHCKAKCRDVVQVMANGLIPTACILLYALSKNHAFIIAYFSAVGAMTADTAASEIGVLSKKEPICILSWKRITRGLSGGISPLGCISGLFGSTVIALLYFLQHQSYGNAVTIAIIGFVGMLSDSLLGACFQAKYRCRVCGIITERKVHCDTQSDYYSGFGLINNDIVNLLSSFTSAILGFFFYIIIHC